MSNPQFRRSTLVPTQLYGRTMSAVLTCPTCENTWESRAQSSRTRCGACRSVVSVPQALRRTTRSTSAAAQAPRRAGTVRQQDTYDESEDELTATRARVLVVVGVVVVGAAVVFWFWRRRMRASPTTTGLRAAVQSTGSHPYSFVSTGRSSFANGTARLTAGAMTRWICGHEQILAAHPRAALGSIPCPVCGRSGIVAQLVAGRFVQVVP